MLEGFVEFELLFVFLELLVLVDELAAVVLAAFGLFEVVAGDAFGEGEDADGEVLVLLLEVCYLYCCLLEFMGF